MKKIKETKGRKSSELNGYFNNKVRGRISFIYGNEPKYNYSGPVWSGPLTRMKLVRGATEDIGIPRRCSIECIQGVVTILPFDWREKEFVKCWWFESGRGLSRKLVSGFLHSETQIHAKTEKSLNSLARAKKKEVEIKENYDKLARNCQRKVNLIAISRAAGNCRVGTEIFLGSLIGGKKHIRARVGAVYRLAVRKKMDSNYNFKRAVSLALKKYSV